ncbi:MAG: hypothetical protein ABJJ37_05740 [Roseibium sp.]
MTYSMYFDQAKATTCSRPNWFDDEGQPISDAVLRANGIYPVQQVPAPIDPLLQSAVWDEPSTWVLVDGVYQRTQTVTDKTLLEVQHAALRDVDEAAEVARMKVLTPGSGQALEYRETEREARAYVSGPLLPDFPMLAAELNAMKIGNPAAVAADVVQDAISNADLWLATGAAIKEVRRSAKVAIEFAALPGDCRSALDWAIAQFDQILVDGTFAAYSA